LLPDTKDRWGQAQLAQPLRRLAMETQEMQESIEEQEAPTEIVESAETDPGEIIQPAEPPAAEEDDPEVTAELQELGLEPDKKGRVSKRIKQLVAQRRQEEEARRLAEEERDAWRGETQRLARSQEKPPDLPPLQVDTSDLPMPNYDDFETEAEYQAAMMRRAAIVALREEKARDEQRQTAIRQQETVAKLENWKAEGRKKFADFDAVALKDDIPITSFMGQALLEHEMGHDIARHLGQNPEEAYRIANLPANLQRTAIGNLAGRVSRPKPKTTTTAPTVSSPVDAGRESVTKPQSIYDPDISFADYTKLRMKQLRERMGS